MGLIWPHFVGFLNLSVGVPELEQLRMNPHAKYEVPSWMWLISRDFVGFFHLTDMLQNLKFLAAGVWAGRQEGFFPFMTLPATIYKNPILGRLCSRRKVDTISQAS